MKPLTVRKYIQRMREYPIFAGGNFIKTPNTFEVVNPFTGKAFAITYLAGEQELKQSIVAAQKCARALAALPSYRRYNILLQISNSIKTNREKLAETLCLESAKPMRYALGEVDRAAQTFLIAAEESKRLPKEYISLDWTPAGMGREGFIKHFPIGLIAGISPFNFPINLAVHKIAPAIAAGCPIILKPSSSTPLSTLELAHIISETDLPKGAVSILPMNRETGNQLVTDDQFKLLSFTGSPEVGWKMKKESGKKKVALELGGNAGVIVTENCDIDDAIQKCLVGGFAYSGQICIHAQRFFVHEIIFDRFIAKFSKAASQLKAGNPLDIQTEVSVMIDEENAKRVEQWMQEAVTAGAKIITGGKRNGSYFEPTILTNTDTAMKVCSTEIFGPVVTVEKYSTFTEAVAMINNSAFGLQAGVFTTNMNEVDQAFNSIEAGGIIINDVPTFRVDHMPYGGIKDSGLGREGIRYAILDMMEPRILVR